MTRRIRGQPKVLVVDDEPDLLELLELTLSRMGLDTSRAENVGDAIRLLRPYGVDVSAGVESAPGVKDPVLIRAFCAAVQRADAEAQAGQV